MEGNSLNIEFKTLTFAYVAIWKKPLTALPPLASPFLKSLFGRPNETQVGFNQNGLAVSLNSAPPQMVDTAGIQALMMPQVANLLLGYQRYSIFDDNLEGLLNAQDKLVTELKSNNNSFYSSLTSAQVGINLEFEYTFNQDTQTLLNKRFLANDIPEFQSRIFQELKFVIVEDNPSKRMTIQIQPRVGNDSAIFVGINDHYGISPSDTIFDKNLLEKFINKTIDKTTNQIKKFISI
jgi:hypothetical protein